MTSTPAALGAVMQLAYVPDDMDAALAYWTKTVGVGPFFRLPHVGYLEARYRGAPSSIDFSVLIAYWGDLQIELIEQHCDSPSIYTRGREGVCGGLHHVCILVDDMAHARATCAAAGMSVEQELFLDGAEAIYVDTGGGPGTILEILQPSPEFHGLFAMMRDAARDWSGDDPVRTLG